MSFRDTIVNGPQTFWINTTVTEKLSTTITVSFAEAVIPLKIFILAFECSFPTDPQFPAIFRIFTLACNLPQTLHMITCVNTHHETADWKDVTPKTVYTHRDYNVCLFVGWLLNVPATCECISGTDLLRQFYVLPH